MSNIKVVAEISANHNGSKQIALDTIKAAKEAGADAVKIQTYTADTITLNCHTEDFRLKHGTIWDGKYLYDLYKEAYTPWEWHQNLFDYAKELNIPLFSTPFDPTAVELLEKLENPIYKIASFEITDIPLIALCASKHKPMVISTGIATEEDINLAVETCRKAGNNDITLLKCTSSYPAPIAEANLVMINDFKQRYGVKAGLSDHTIGSVVPVTSVAMGATMIEKHFIIDRSIGGPDSSFSMDKSEFTQMVENVRLAEKAIGNVNYSLSERAKASREFSRSLYVAQDMKVGDAITEENVRSVRPGYSLQPKYYYQILGKKVKCDLHFGDRLSLEQIDLH